MNKKTILSLYKKEMLDILRDKKTIIMMVLVPIVLYPMLIFGGMFTANKLVDNSKTKEYKVVTFDKKLVHLFEEDVDNDFDVKFGENEKQCLKLLQKKKIDVYITVNEEKSYKINYISSVNDSYIAGNLAFEILQTYKNDLTKNILKRKDLDAKKILNPITFEMTNQATSEESVGATFGNIIPMIIILTMFLGALYPAIDVTAGERERGTLETMMTLPITNVEMMISKFFAVSTVAIVSSILNIMSMTFVSVYMYDTMKMYGSGINTNVNMVKFVPALIIALLCIMAFAMFTSAICLCVCVFAKSFKEANNYCSPIIIIFAFLSMVTIIPTIEFRTVTAILPVINIALLVREIFVLHYDFQLIIITLFMNIAYSFVMLIVMSKIFNSEEVLFGQGFNGAKLFERRKNMKEKQMPTIKDIILLFIAIFLILMLTSKGILFSSGSALKKIALIQFTLISVTIVYAIYIKADFKKLFSLKVPRFHHFISGIMLWVGGVCIINVFMEVFYKVFPQLHNNTSSSSGGYVGGILKCFLIVACMPAIAEEIVNRGFLFGTLKNKIDIKYAVVISAFLFGAFHMNLTQFIFGFFMGILMAIAVYMSESIIVSIFMHMLNNGITVFSAYYPRYYNKIPILSKSEVGIRELIILVIVGVVSIFLGIFLLKMGKTKTKSIEN